MLLYVVVVCTACFPFQKNVCVENQTTERKSITCVYALYVRRSIQGGVIFFKKKEMAGLKATVKWDKGGGVDVSLRTFLGRGWDEKKILLILRTCM